MLRHQGATDAVIGGTASGLCGMIGGPALGARCGVVAVQATEDLLNPQNHEPTCLGGHMASGVEQTMEGAVTGSPVKGATGLTEVVTYGTKAVSESWNWLKGHW
jgi:hypothetical protein